MEERTEIWIVTTLSILAACVIGAILRRGLYYLLRTLALSIEQRQLLVRASETIHGCISTYMLVVGTYEKGILLGEGLIFEYYLSTLILTVIYRYILNTVSPNPLPVMLQSWKDVSEEVRPMENGDVEAHPTIISTSDGGIRRRGGDVLSRDDHVVLEERHRAPHDQIYSFLRKSAPSLLGLYLGLHAAIQWLHFAWDGYLTSHHNTKTGLLRDCIIVLQTGPVQGFVIEAFVTFFFQFIALKLDKVRFGNPSQSYLVSSILYSVVTTAALYFFINITGSFANPLLAYALERECLYDTASVINHIIVYWFGALAGAIAYNILPETKHLQLISVTCGLFLFIYFFTPGAIVRPFIFY